jgi:thiol-disulfide isomerase/thioredoxin
MRLISFLFLFSLFCPFVYSQSNELKTGEWTGYLQLNDTTSLFFKCRVKKNVLEKSGITIEIINANESIPLVSSMRNDNDSIEFTFPNFNSLLILLPKGNNALSGYWKNKNKGENYVIPCSINYGYTFRFPFNTKPSTTALLSGKWESTFSPNTTHEEKSIGLFKQEKNIVTGTFLTETGDYRFLDGNVFQNKLYLSCFDGSHAFLFTANINNNEIKGQFYSGKHYNTEWVAKRNDAFSLTHPDSLTKHDPSKNFSFTFNGLDGKVFTYPNEAYKDKVVVIQIMGTWCPNCMDEIVFLKELYNKYHTEGLEIISIAYETGTNPEQHIKQITKLIERKDLSHQFLLGGTANKKLASEHFNSLNKVMSFPTTIFIDKTGKIQKIHTGFNGPGTGELYEQFTKETTGFVKKLLEKN